MAHSVATTYLSVKVFADALEDFCVDAGEDLILGGIERHVAVAQNQSTLHLLNIHLILVLKQWWKVTKVK